jgi:hypothetical protein
MASAISFALGVLLAVAVLYLMRLREPDRPRGDRSR